VDAIKSGFKEMGLEGVTWIPVAQERKKWLPVVCLFVTYVVS
jgi:hypothetical protein